MSHYINTVRIRAALSILADIDPTDRLDALKQLAIEDGGRWDLPAGNYQPLIRTVEVYGVHGMASADEDLTNNWMAVAKTIIAGIDVATPELLPAQDPQCEASGPTKPEGMESHTPPAFFETGRPPPKLTDSAWKPKVGEPVLYQNSPSDPLKAGTVSAIEYAPHAIEVQDRHGVLSRVNPRLIRPIDPRHPQGGDAVEAPVDLPPPEATGATIDCPVCADSRQVRLTTKDSVNSEELQLEGLDCSRCEFQVTAPRGVSIRRFLFSMWPDLEKLKTRAGAAQ